MTCRIVPMSAKLSEVRLVSSYLVHAGVLHADQFWVEQDLWSPISFASELTVKISQSVNTPIFA